MKKEIKLSTGVTVEMREPKVRDMMVAGEETNAERKEVLMVANLCNLTFEEVADMSIKDYKKLQDVMLGFMS